MLLRLAPVLADHREALRAQRALLVRLVDVVRLAVVEPQIADVAHHPRVLHQLLQQPLQRALAAHRVPARVRDRGPERAVRGDERRLEQLRAPDEAPREVVERERLLRPVLAREALADLGPEHAAAHERDGEEVVRAGEAREVHDADAVHALERGRVERGDFEPLVKVVDVVLFEVVEAPLDELLALVLVPEADVR